MKEATTWALTVGTKGWGVTMGDTMDITVGGTLFVTVERIVVVTVGSVVVIRVGDTIGVTMGKVYTRARYDELSVHDG